MFFQRDHSIIKEIQEDVEAYGGQHLRNLNEYSMYDSPDAIENCFKTYYDQGLHHHYTKHYPQVFHHRLYFNLGKEIALPDRLAFNYGHVVHAYCILLKNRCFGCGHNDLTKALDACAGCHIALYCSNECQVKDRDRHKAFCNRVKADIETNNRASTHIEQIADYKLA